MLSANHPDRWPTRSCLPASRLLAALLAGVLLLAACGGDGEKRTTGGAVTPRPAEDRPTVEEQLAIIDGSRMPETYREVLDGLAQKCREPRTEVADAVVEGRRNLAGERGIHVSVLDYLRGVDSVIPAGRTGEGCRAIITELERTIGR